MKNIRTARYRSRGGVTRASGILLVLLGAFLLGCVLGTLLGADRFSETGAEVFSDKNNIYGSDGFLSLLFSCCKYHLAVALLSTSLLGAALIPCVIAARGFVFACTAAAIAASYPGADGVLLVLIVLGIPSLITLPCLFMLGRDGFCMSAGLLAVFDRRSPYPLRFDAAWDGLVCAAALIAAAAMETFVVPFLAGLII